MQLAYSIVKADILGMQGKTRRQTKDKGEVALLILRQDYLESIMATLVRQMENDSMQSPTRLPRIRWEVGRHVPKPSVEKTTISLCLYPLLFHREVWIGYSRVRHMVDVVNVVKSGYSVGTDNVHLHGVDLSQCGECYRDVLE